MSHSLDSQYPNLTIQKAVLREALIDWKFYLIGILSMFAGVSMNLISPIFIRKIIDEAIVGQDTSNLWIYVSGIIAVALGAAVFNYGNRYFNDLGAEKTIFRLRNKLFEKIQTQSLKFLYEQETGQLMTRATADLSLIKNYLRREFRLGLNSIYYFVSIGFLIYATQASFLLVYAVLLPFLIVIGIIYGKKSRPLFRERRQAFGDISSKIQENIKAIETIRSFNQEKFEQKRFESDNEQYMNLYIKAEIVRGLTLPVALMIVSIGSVGVLLIGGYDLIVGISGLGAITLGTLVQFNLYILQLVTPTRLIGNFIVGYNRTNVSGERVFEILWSESEIKEKENAMFPDNFQGKIEFQNVSFSYENGVKILDDINLIVNANHTVAIFGSTGSGKSTLINLIPRFFDPTDGRVLVDDIDVRELKLELLRKNVVTVSQDIFLFSRSIKENISFGKPEATDQDIITAAKAAQAHNFITELPDGYETIIGERGITLSGGQQQRLTIARAILMQPRILILDDSTSSVDAETEYQIQNALEQLLENRTTLIITQKVSSARNASKIIVLENGIVLEEGTHEELLAQQGIYNKIYETQRDEELERELFIEGGD